MLSKWLHSRGGHGRFFSQAVKSLHLLKGRLLKLYAPLSGPVPISLWDEKGSTGGRREIKGTALGAGYLFQG